MKNLMPTLYICSFFGKKWKEIGLKKAKKRPYRAQKTGRKLPDGEDKARVLHVLSSRARVQYTCLGKKVLPARSLCFDPWSPRWTCRAFPYRLVACASSKEGFKIYLSPLIYLELIKMDLSTQARINKIKYLKYCRHPIFALLDVLSLFNYSNRSRIKKYQKKKKKSQKCKKVEY